MTAAAFFKRFQQSPAAAALAYAVIVIALLLITWLTLAGLSDAYADLSAATERLAGLNGHGKSETQSPRMSGSPFLDGATVTIAGADLQQRVVAAVGAVGGNVLSSQVDLQGSQASQGYVLLTASCEISQTALQPLLYDLEAGMPFLFVEQLIVQAPQSSGEPESKRMRVQIDVAGQWQAPK